jgi:hypothetical protein
MIENLTLIGRHSRSSFPEEILRHPGIQEMALGCAECRLEAKVDTYRAALRTSREFVDVQEVRKAWVRRYSCQEHLQLLQTFSDRRAILEPDKSCFFEAIESVIRRLGGEVLRDYETLALLAKKG